MSSISAALTVNTASPFNAKVGVSALRNKTSDHVIADDSASDFFACDINRLLFLIQELEFESDCQLLYVRSMVWRKQAYIS